MRYQAALPPEQPRLTAPVPYVYHAGMSDDTAGVPCRVRPRPLASDLFYLDGSSTHSPTSPAGDSGSAFSLLMWAILILLPFLASCSTVRVTAEHEAHCIAKKGPPHLVQCWVDGKLRYEQRGPMKLNVSTPDCKCKETPDAR